MSGEHTGIAELQYFRTHAGITADHCQEFGNPHVWLINKSLQTFEVRCLRDDVRCAEHESSAIVVQVSFDGLIDVLDQVVHHDGLGEESMRALTTNNLFAVFESGKDDAGGFGSPLSQDASNWTCRL